MWDILIFAKNEPRDIMGVALVMRTFEMLWQGGLFQQKVLLLLGGGFKDFLCSPLFGEDSHFD